MNLKPSSPARVYNGRQLMIVEDITMKLQKITLSTLLSSALMATAFALPQASYAGESFTDWATITRVEPVERRYTVRRPVEKCWTETVRVQGPGRSDGSITNELIGGILGGVVGNQFGDGSGKDAMTIAGAALGASIANDQEKTHSGQQGGHYKEVERCETVYETEEKTERSGYRVTYRYNGHSFTTRMKSRPRDSIRVRVTVTPQ